MCDNLATLYEILFSARTEWFDIGLNLKLNIYDLNAINAEHPENLGICLRKMLVMRLDVVGPLSWREVCACLRSPTVGRIDIAETIEGKGTVLYR